MHYNKGFTIFLLLLLRPEGALDAVYGDDVLLGRVHELELADEIALAALGQVQAVHVQVAVLGGQKQSQVVLDTETMFNLVIASCTY